MAKRPMTPGEIMRDYPKLKARIAELEEAAVVSKTESTAKPWAVHCICCGRDDGTYHFATYKEAHALRDSYTSGPGVGPGRHDRSAIVKRNPEAPGTHVHEWMPIKDIPAHLSGGPTEHCACGALNLDTEAKDDEVARLCEELADHAGDSIKLALLLDAKTEQCDAWKEVFARGLDCEGATTTGREREAAQALAKALGKARDLEGQEEPESLARKAAESVRAEIKSTQIEALFDAVKVEFEEWKRRNQVSETDCEQETCVDCEGLGICGLADALGERDKLKTRIEELEKGDETLAQLLSERDHNLFDLETETAQVKTLEKETILLKRLLWIRHGCGLVALYGDDGEMQCNNASCMIDFRRMSAKDIEERWVRYARTQIEKAGGVDAVLKSARALDTETKAEQIEALSDAVKAAEEEMTQICDPVCDEGTCHTCSFHAAVAKARDLDEKPVTKKEQH